MFFFFSKIRGVDSMNRELLQIRRLYVVINKSVCKEKIEQTRIKLLSEIPALIGLFYYYRKASERGLYLKGRFDFSSVKQTKDLTIDQITDFIKEFKLELNKYKEDLSDLSQETWESFVRDYAQKNNLKASSLFMALRLVITDSQFSPPLLEVVKILGKSEVLLRLESNI